MSSPSSELRLHVLGHTYISDHGRPLPVSAKGTALLTYLSLERRPFHREQLAELLWTSSDALRNLRVELNRLRHLSPGLIPERLPMLEVALPTDLEHWIERASTLTADEVGDWLSIGTGVPLSGLEDLGSAELRSWVDGQRWRIVQTVETHMSAAHARLLRAGKHDAADMIALRAEQLGWALQPVPVVRQGLSFTSPGLHRSLLPALGAARGRPQIAVLSGRSAQARREVVDGLTQGEWRTVHVECPPEADLLLAALLHQLGAFKWADQAVNQQIQTLLDTPDATRHNIVRLWTLYAQVGEPLIVVFNEIVDPALVLPHVQVAMNLPADLLLVLCPADQAALRSLQLALSGIDRSRQHALHLPALGVSEVMDALSGQQARWSEERRYAYAARMAMDSDGWEPLTRSLLDDHVELGATRPRLPQSAREVLLRDTASLPARLRADLARLALAHTPLSPALAEVLLEDAPGILAHAEQLRLLLPCDPVEVVHLPQLQYRASDQSDTLCFASEPLRVALASVLSRGERQDIRRRLARATAESDPFLGAHYARQAGEDPPPIDRQGNHCRTLQGHPVPLSEGMPTLVAGQRRECRTGGGYRVVMEGGFLQILRHGLYGRPVTLRLPWGQVPGGKWWLTARIDALRSGPDLGPCSNPYALAWQVGGDHVIVGTSPTLEVPSGSGRVTYHTAPPGRLFTLSGEGQGGPAELRVCAMDVAVTVTSLRVAHIPLLNPAVPPADTRGG